VGIYSAAMNKHSGGKNPLEVWFEHPNEDVANMKQEQYFGDETRNCCILGSNKNEVWQQK
jgi:hypothetical protein